MNVDALTVSASGLRAQRVRMEVIANNIANADTTDAGFVEEKVGEQTFKRYLPYRRKMAVFSPGLESRGPGLLGVKVPAVVDVAGPFPMEENSNHPHRVKTPHARDENVLYKPNVEPIIETTDMIAASRAYEANVMAIDALKSMGAASLRILA